MYRRAAEEGATVLAVPTFPPVSGESSLVFEARVCGSEVLLRLTKKLEMCFFSLASSDVMMLLKKAVFLFSSED